MKLTKLVLFIIFSILIQFNINGQDTPKEVDPETMLTEELRNEIKSNLVYPTNALKNKISAYLYVEVIGDSAGKVINATIRRTNILDNSGKKTLITDYNPSKDKSIDYNSIKSLHEEAIRICKGFTKFYHGEDLKGNKINALVVIPIKFTYDEYKK
ncbi:MAG: hypothetical protein SFY32_05605 [Bacteroidota bacterium]|nr:hypothetical protein [Bacteroidota bacterium]